MAHLLTEQGHANSVRLPIAPSATQMINARHAKLTLLSYPIMNVDFLAQIWLLTALSANSPTNVQSANQASFLTKSITTALLTPTAQTSVKPVPTLQNVDSAWPTILFSTIPASTTVESPTVLTALTMSASSAWTPISYSAPIASSSAASTTVKPVSLPLSIYARPVP